MTISKNHSNIFFHKVMIAIGLVNLVQDISIAHLVHRDIESSHILLKILSMSSRRFCIKFLSTKIKTFLADVYEFCPMNKKLASGGSQSSEKFESLTFSQDYEITKCHLTLAYVFTD